MNEWEYLNNEERSCVGCMALATGLCIRCLLLGIGALLLEELLEQWGMAG